MPKIQLLLLLGLWLGLVQPAHAAQLTVAAASSVQEPLLEIARRFEQDTGHRVRPVFGASGKLYAQIAQGAPFDVYFSADTEFPAKLHARGLADAPRRFARGRLVLWAPAGSPFDVTRGLAVLQDARLRKLAIANPRLAPYGRAAVEAMRAAGVYAAVEQKLAMGENVAQTLQFVQSGGADLALVPLSLARSPKLAGQGRHVLLPASGHAPIDSEAAVLNRAHDRALAERFLAFCMGDRARSIWRRYGLTGE